jgi:hypothetical protein
LSTAYLTQFVVSATAVAMMIGVAAWGTRGRAPRPLDQDRARRGFADEFPGRPLDALWVASDGLGAVAKSGDSALVLSAMGDGYAARAIAWDQAARATFKDGHVQILLRDVAAPKAVLAFPAWPPKELAA